MINSHSAGLAFKRVFEREILVFNLERIKRKIKNFMKTHAQAPKEKIYWGLEKILMDSKDPEVKKSSEKKYLEILESSIKFLKKNYGLDFEDIKKLAKALIHHLKSFQEAVLSSYRTQEYPDEDDDFYPSFCLLSLEDHSLNPKNEVYPNFFLYEALDKKTIELSLKRARVTPSLNALFSDKKELLQKLSILNVILHRFWGQEFFPNEQPSDFFRRTLASGILHWAIIMASKWEDDRNSPVYSFNVQNFYEHLDGLCLEMVKQPRVTSFMAQIFDWIFRYSKENVLMNPGILGEWTDKIFSNANELNQVLLQSPRTNHGYFIENSEDFQGICYNIAYGYRSAHQIMHLVVQSDGPTKPLEWDQVQANHSQYPSYLIRQYPYNPIPQFPSYPIPENFQPLALPKTPHISEFSYYRSIRLSTFPDKRWQNLFIQAEDFL